MNATHRSRRISRWLTLLALAAFAQGCSDGPRRPGTGPAGGGGGATVAGGSGGGAGTAMGGSASGQSGSGTGAVGGTAATGGSTGGQGGSLAGSGGSAGSDAEDTARDMGFGVNIGNTLENTTAWETGWGQPLITQEFISGMAESGIKTIRLPVAWDTYAENGVVPSDKMARVREVVEWILEAEMYAIVNIHWDGGWIRSDGTANQYRLTDGVRQKFRSYWEQIAGEFADLGDHLVFEGLNEEGEFYVNGNQSNGRDYAPLNELNQSFVDTVRAAGGENENRILLIAGFLTDIAATCVNEFAIPVDPAGSGKLLLSIHYYTPFPFTLMSEPTNWNGIVYPATTWGTPAEQAELAGLFQTLATFTRSRGIPAVIGEFTATTGDGAYVRESASRVRWMSAVSETAMSYGMVPVLWDTGGDIRRSDGSLSTDLSAVTTELGL
jgi:endoglucanase